MIPGRDILFCRRPRHLLQFPLHQERPKHRGQFQVPARSPLSRQRSRKAQRLPSSDGLTEFPTCLRPIFRTAPAPLQEWKLPLHHISKFGNPFPFPGRHIPPPATNRCRPRHATANKGISSSGIQGALSRANVTGTAGKKLFFRILSPNLRSRRNVSAAVVNLAPFLAPRIWSLSRQFWRRSVRLLRLALPVFPAAFLAGYFTFPAAGIQNLFSPSLHWNDQISVKRTAWYSTK